MIKTEFKGKKLSNASTALAIYYPEISGGHDMLNDIKDLKEEKSVSVKVLLQIYASFRKAADTEGTEARKMSFEELANEVDFFNKKEQAEFQITLNSLLNERKTDPNS